MPDAIETNHSGEFLISRSNGQRSMEQGVLASGQNLVAGAVLGVVTASGAYAEYDNAAADGTQTAVAILYSAVDATDGDQACAVVARDAEVSKELLVFEATQDGPAKTAAFNDLAAAGIIARDN